MTSAIQWTWWREECLFLNPNCVSGIIFRLVTSSERVLTYTIYSNTVYTYIKRFTNFKKRTKREYKTVSARTTCIRFSRPSSLSSSFPTLARRYDHVTGGQVKRTRVIIRVCLRDAGDDNAPMEINYAVVSVVPPEHDDVREGPRANV